MEQKKFTGTQKKNADHSFAVTAVHQFNDGTVKFNLVVDGFVTIYGCGIAEGQQGPFVTFPSRKGKDDRYWKHAFCAVPAEDVAKIVQQIDNELTK